MPWGGLNGTSAWSRPCFLPLLWFCRLCQVHSIRLAPKPILTYNHWAGTLAEAQSWGNVQIPPLHCTQAQRNTGPGFPRTQTPQSQYVAGENFSAIRWGDALLRALSQPFHVYP